MAYTVAIEMRVDQVHEIARRIRDSIMQSSGESVSYHDVLAILDLVSELADIVRQESRENARAINSLAEYHN